MSVSVQRLEPTDWPLAKPYWIEAFGEDDDESPPGPGRHIWRVDDGGATAALGVVREFSSWFGTARVPTAGIAGITVPAEQRGAGHLRPLFTALLDEARARGEQISALYPTSTGIYRSLGYAPVATHDVVEVPTADLAAVRGEAASVRRATETDLPAIAALYATWASQHRGPLTRDGVSFPDQHRAFFNEITGVTLAESSPGVVSGYASWKRGKDYGPGAELTVRDLVALDRPSMVALLRTLGSFSAVTPVSTIGSTGRHEWIGLLRSDNTRLRKREHYLAAILDIEVFTHLRPPADLAAALPFSWRGKTYELMAANGQVEVSQATRTPHRTLDDTALVMSLFGSADSATLRRLGHLSGEATDDAAWDAITVAGPPPAILNYY